MAINFDVIKVTKDQNSSAESSTKKVKDTDWETTKISREHADNTVERTKQLAELIEDSKQNRLQRKEYAGKIFGLVCGWLGALTIIVGCTGFGFMKLSDAVLITLITSASVNIIGLMVIVTNYLFPKNGLSMLDLLKNKKEK